MGSTFSIGSASAQASSIVCAPIGLPAVSHQTKASTPVCSYCAIQPPLPMYSCVVFFNWLESRRCGPERQKEAPPQSGYGSEGQPPHQREARPRHGVEVGCGKPLAPTGHAGPEPRSRAAKGKDGARRSRAAVPSVVLNGVTGSARRPSAPAGGTASCRPPCRSRPAPHSPR